MALTAKVVESAERFFSNRPEETAGNSVSKMQ